MEEEGVMSPGYFQLIYEKISGIGWFYTNQIEQLKVNIGMLEMFCTCLELWKYSSIDEENMERLRSVTTCLKVIWPADLTLLSLLHQKMDETETRPINVCFEDFDSIMSGFKAKILQTKRQIESWCPNSIQDYHCKSPNISQDFILEFLQKTLANLGFLSGYRRSPYLEQIHSLEIRLMILQELLKSVRDWGFQFMNFMCDFAHNVACLTCLFWAKEDDEEHNASELDIVLYDMLHRFIPSCADILKSKLVSDSFPHREESAIETFVEFFFDHLEIVLKDDFLLLRDRLLSLFTFLSNPQYDENAEEGEDLIHSQIYAILHEDVYLLMSFDKIKEDFYGGKALLSGFMTRIDVENAKIRQVYCGSSESLITLEVVTMEHDYIVSIHRELSWIEDCEGGDVGEKIQLYKMELRFLRVFLQWLATWDDADENIKVKLSSVITSFREIWGDNEAEGLLVRRLHSIRRWGMTGWPPLAFELQEKIQRSKLETEAWCLSLFNSSFQFKSSTSYKILKFLDSIHENLNDLVSYKASEIIPFKKQIDTLEGKLIFLKNFLKLTMNCVHYEELGEFKKFVQALANDAARLSIHYWAIDANAKSASETNSVLVHMLEKIKPATPDVARLYFGALTAIYVQQSDSLMFGQMVLSFVELLLDDLVNHLKDDDFHILQDNIVFLMTFLKDPLNQNAEESICSQIDILFWEGLYSLIPFDDIEGGFSEKKMLLFEFMMKIEAMNDNVRRIYGKFPHSSLYNFPTVISPQFLDFLFQNIGNLKDRMNSDRKYASFAKYKIIKIEEELASLRPFFIHIFNLQSEVNEIWLEVVNVLHLTEHVIISCVNSCFVFDYPFWYHMTYLSNVFDEIKVVKAKLEMVINNAKSLPSSVGFISELAEQGRPSEINEIVVGFEDEEEKIIDMLILGSESLDIVSIVGMGGLGKTTLARKAFRSPSITSHFHVFAFCSVSHDPDIRSLLREILREVKGGGDDIDRDMTKDDLAHKLWQCLSGRKYLVVLDDIWKASAWNEIRSSFPDNENGSRVMFTTRSREVADECRIYCRPHQLRLLNDNESWELLQEKVFRDGSSPSYLCEIGKHIAKNCKGLALAVVVIGGLLARTEESLSKWSEIAQRLVHYLSKEEGCMDILELSYKYLPENLKPCLAYLGAFPEDRLLSVKYVILLWISEGFIQESKTKSLEDVARVYFRELVDRSFIIVDGRSSSGQIKTFQVHDLIRELCQTKCRDGNFFHMNHEGASSSSSEPSVNYHYRVSMQKESDFTNVAGSSLFDARTIQIFFDDVQCKVPLKKFRRVQVLDIYAELWTVSDINEFTSLIHLRYINAIFLSLSKNSIPSSIFNLWNLVSLKLTSKHLDDGAIHLPETFWRMKSLRYVKVPKCILKFPDDVKHEADQILDKVVSFSKPVLSTVKDVERLLQRLPSVRKLKCDLKISPEYDEEESSTEEDDEETIETLDFNVELESLRLNQPRNDTWRRQYIFNFPSTLKKLTLECSKLSHTNITAIAGLECLEVLKLKYGYFSNGSLEMRDLVFENLKYFELSEERVVEWNASADTFPCLEQLEIQYGPLKEVPRCFGEVSTLKRIIVYCYYPETETSVLKIQEELIDLGLGKQLEVSIQKMYR